MKHCLVAAMATAALTAPVAAQDDTPYYEGKTINFVIGFSPGGGTDFFGRLMAQNLGRHIEGNPTIVVQNMPGAGSVLASNYYVDRAPRDGTEIMVGTGQLLMRIVLGLEGSSATLADFEPVVALPMGRISYASTDTGLETVEDLAQFDGRLILGVPEVISTIDAVLGLRVLDIDYRAIVGYEGKSDALLAFERGEVDVDAQTTPVYLSRAIESVEAGRAFPLFAQGLLDADGELVRDPAAPDIPTVAEIHELLHGTPPSGPAWEAYRAAVTAIGNGGKILMVHSDAPEEARQALSDAVESLIADEDFLEQAAREMEGYTFTTGSELSVAVNSVANMSEDDTAWFKEFLTENFDMRFE